jgi:hypothetical protein
MIQNHEIGQLLIKAVDENLTDEEAELLIDKAVGIAAEEIRTRALQARKTEKTLMEHQRKVKAEQEAIAAGNLARLEAERQQSLARQAALRQAENL